MSSSSSTTDPSSTASTSFDSAQYKIGQRQGWDSVAIGWQKWWKAFEGSAQRLSDKLVELAEIGPGQQVLDVATGIGEPAITAAKRIGANGQVLATDISPQMLSIAKERAASSLDKLQDIVEFREVDAEEMFDLPASSFDAVLCRWGLMFLPSPHIALRGIHRSLVSGGRFAAAVWAEKSKVPVLGLPIDIINRELQIAVPTTSSDPSKYTPGLFSLANASRLENYLTEAGFKDVYSEILTIPFEFASAEEFTHFVLDISAPIRYMLEKETEKRKEGIRNAITEEARRQYSISEEDNGQIRLDSEVVSVVGRKS
jgi:ubiquinone/menaquinone biosynthesis C-methylase UbiE